MNSLIAALLIAISLIFSSAAQATPLSDLNKASVSALEFGSFKLEVALSGIKDWPFPIEGASVFYKPEPDQIELSVGVNEVRGAPFRTVCAKTLERVRLFLKAGNGVPLVGRSFLSSYYRGLWHGAARETALQALDAATIIKVLVVGGGSCQAGLVQSPITFDGVSSK